MLQASIVSVYISFLTASALAAFPAKESRYPMKNGTETTMVTEFVKCRNYDIFGISDEQMKISGSRSNDVFQIRNSNKVLHTTHK